MNKGGCASRAKQAACSIGVRYIGGIGGVSTFASSRRIKARGCRTVVG